MSQYTTLLEIPSEHKATTLEVTKAGANGDGVLTGFAIVEGGEPRKDWRAIIDQDGREQLIEWLLDESARHGRLTRDREWALTQASKLVDLSERAA